jgi:primase-polymerase (primpol)-like protein
MLLCVFLYAPCRIEHRLLVSMLPEQHRREQGILKAAFYRERLLPLDSLSEIVHLHQWINWQYRLVHGERRKVPIIPRNGHNASTTDPSTWGTLHQAIKRLELSPVDGIGLVVTQADPYCFVDIDHSADKKNRIITRELGLRVATLLDTLSEFSPNDGLHFLVKLDKPLPQACKSDVEIYDRGRYMTFTMDTVPGTPLVIATRQAEIEQLWTEFKSKERSLIDHSSLS